MKLNLGEIFFTWIFLESFANVSGNLENGKTTSMGTDNNDSAEDYEETEDPFMTELQSNYRNGLNHFLDFCTSTNSALTKINNRLEKIEILQSSITKKQNSAASSLKFQRIASELPGSSLAVKFVNNLQTDLTNYKCELAYGLIGIRPSDRVTSEETEIATFKPTSDHPEGTMVYRIGQTDLYLQVYFDCFTNFRTFAAAFLQTEKPQKTIGLQRCNHSSRPTGPSGSYKCSTNVPYGTTTSLQIQRNNIYAKLTFNPKYSASTLIIEVS